MKHTLTLLTALLSISAFAQLNNDYNFGAEKVVAGQPVGWNNKEVKGYRAYADSMVVHHGKYSVAIEQLSDASNFKAISVSFPKNFQGKKLTFKAFVKTEAVTSGFCALWARIDPEVAFDNMARRSIKGTTDWTEYEIELDMKPEITTNIVVGAMLIGGGKMWVDDISVQVDGKSVELLGTIDYASPPKAVSSTISLANLTAQQMDNLNQLGLVWGYMKYYHPAVTSGKYDWDQELFKITPAVLKAGTNAERDAVLQSWVAGYPCEKNFLKIHHMSKIPGKLEPDLSWMGDQKMSSGLKKELEAFRYSERPAVLHYVTTNATGGARFEHENPYVNIDFADDGYRMLALFRYWNMVHYFFPNRHLIDQDWKKVLPAYIPRFAAAKDQKLYLKTCESLIGEIQDTHAQVNSYHPVLELEKGIRTIPALLTFVDGKAVVCNYFQNEFEKNTKLKRGDVIKKVNGVAVDDLIREMISSTPASNYPTQLRDIGRRLMRTNANELSLTVESPNGNTWTENIPTYGLEEVDYMKPFEFRDTCFKMLDNGIAYISNGNLRSEYLPKIWESLKNAKGLIIDSRFYPHDYLVFTLPKYLMPEFKPFVQYTQISTSEPGKFTFGVTEGNGQKNKNAFKGSIVILVNENTQSSAEYHAMAYRVHPRAVVMGSTTAGADGDVIDIELPGNVKTRFSGIGILYPDGRETQRVGIVPDIEVHPTIAGIRDGRDEVLERAMEYLKKRD